MKHKNYEYIVAFAEGKEVQYYDTIVQGWCRVMRATLFDYQDTQFRIKPEVKKTVGYRRYIKFDSYKQTYHVDTVSSSDMHDPSLMRYFIRWLDTDWKYEDVETN